MKLPETKILAAQFLQTMRMRNCSQRTINCWRYTLNRFAAWCEERDIECLSEVTLELMTAYRRHLFHYRNANTGKRLRFDSQAHYLSTIRSWFAWLVACGMLEVDPTIGLELPKAENRLPVSILTTDQIESLLNLPDVSTPLGIRNKAILETFYSCGIRCGELAALDVFDISAERGVLTVRLGKNRKDRVVPIGQRALSWIEKWMGDVRPQLVASSSDQALYVSKNGKRMGPNYVSYVVRQYMTKVGIKQKGSCHLLRHTAATMMMENGADLRAIQMYLGHARLDTTQIYTHVSIKRLKEVHKNTHPADLKRLDLPNDESEVDGAASESVDGADLKS